MPKNERIKVSEGDRVARACAREVVTCERLLRATVELYDYHVVAEFMRFIGIYEHKGQVLRVLRVLRVLSRIL